MLYEERGYFFSSFVLCREWNSGMFKAVPGEIEGYKLGSYGLYGCLQKWAILI
jgi:hypothetical protein